MTNDPDYAPFPEMELRALAGWHAQCARLWKPDSVMRAEHEARAKVCRDALDAHAAMRERMLIAELELGQARQGAA